MPDRPIIFSAPMVRALLAGRKTQTRRLIKPQPKVLKNGIWYRPYPVLRPLHWAYFHGDRVTGFADVRYATGDRLYVREAWRAGGLNFGKIPRDMCPGIGRVHYAATDDGGWKTYWGAWKPSIHMPRWASRITLTVTEVRVQRLQEISEADAMAEGVDAVTLEDVPRQAAMSRRSDFAALWNSLHGPEAWDANPWVVAVSFTVRKGNIDQIGGGA